jgi:putative ABC transport system ATP-binding protein
VTTGTALDQVVTAEGLQLSFGSTPVLRGLDVGLAGGRVVAIMGPSGSGKSTLLHCLAGILVPDSGSVHVLGRPLVDLAERDRARLRLRHMGFVLQGGELVPELTLAENVALPLQLLGTRHREAMDRAAAILDAVGLAGAGGRRTGEVSGGESQRAAVARALVHEPDIVFADEPTGALDTVNGEQVLDLLLESSRARGAAVLLVTHDHRIAAHADHVMIMRDGRIVQESGA